VMWKIDVINPSLSLPIHSMISPFSLAKTPQIFCRSLEMSRQNIGDSAFKGHFGHQARVSPTPLAALLTQKMSPVDHFRGPTIGIVERVSVPSPEAFDFFQDKFRCVWYKFTNGKF
jgi:hypothetical protein